MEITKDEFIVLDILTEDYWLLFHVTACFGCKDAEIQDPATLEITKQTVKSLLDKGLAEMYMGKELCDYAFDSDYILLAKEIEGVFNCDRYWWYIKEAKLPHVLMTATKEGEKAYNDFGRNNIAFNEG